jgi:hypothetical protein
MTNDQLPAIIPPGALTTPTDTYIVPALIADLGEQAAWRYVEFFTANINNDHTRRAYARACARFFAWCEDRGLTLTAIRPFDVAAWVKELQENHGAPGVKQQLASWPGNTADVTTLLPVVERLRSRFGVSRACVVADRGMISAATVAALEAQGIDYILGVRERSTVEVRSTVIDDDGVAIPLTIPRQKGETDLAIKDVVVAGRRYVLCRNAEQARKDAETRTALLAGLERKLTQGDKALVGNAGYRRFLAEPAGEGFTIDAAKVEAEARFDGLFVLRTNTKLTAPQVVLRYRNLLAVEQGFLAAKTLLATRPIFHRTDAAIRGHIFCTFLALVLRKELMDRLAAHHLALPEWQNIVDDLADLSEIEVEQDGRRALLRTAPGPFIDPLCRAVGVTLPPVFQELPST